MGRPPKGLRDYRVEITHLPNGKVECGVDKARSAGRPHTGGHCGAPGGNFTPHQVNRFEKSAALVLPRCRRCPLPPRARDMVMKAPRQIRHPLGRRGCAAGPCRRGDSIIGLDRGPAARPRARRWRPRWRRRSKCVVPTRRGDRPSAASCTSPSSRPAHRGALPRCADGSRWPGGGGAAVPGARGRMRKTRSAAFPGGGNGRNATPIAQPFRPKSLRRPQHVCAAGPARPPLVAG